MGRRQGDERGFIPGVFPTSSAGQSAVRKNLAEKTETFST